MKKRSFFYRTTLCVGALSLFFACSSDDRDMEKPSIDMSGANAFPSTCDVVYRGESFTLKALFTDNDALGNYNIDVHENFDNHSHSTDNVHCEHDGIKKPENPFHFNQDFGIPEGSSSFSAENTIAIPDDVDTGDYHLSIRVTDKSGWQQIKAIGIKVRDRE